MSEFETTDEKTSPWVPVFRFHAEQNSDGGWHLHAQWNWAFMICALLIAAALGYLALA